MISRIIMKNLDKLHGLNPYLFWDFDTTQFDIDENAAWIIQRVLEYGQMNDWNIIEKQYGLDRIVSIAMNFRTLNPVARSFLRFLSGVKKEDFRCYRIAQSNPTLWNS